MKYNNLTTALAEAKKLSIHIRDYVAVVRTGSTRIGTDEYHIETEPPYIRNNEKLIAEFEKGIRTS